MASRTALEGSAHAGLWVTKDDDVYIPDADNLRMRCAIVAHQGSGLHRKVDAMHTSIQAAKCWWPKMRDTLKKLTSLCMCCVWTMEGKRIPRATVETLYATKAGEAVAMDFLYIGPSDDGFKYILVLKDMCSQRVRLVNCTAADSAAATNALLAWCADFGAPTLLVSDQGAHFINSTLEEVNRIRTVSSSVGSSSTAASSTWYSSTFLIVAPSESSTSLLATISDTALSGVHPSSR